MFDRLDELTTLSDPDSWLPDLSHLGNWSASGVFSPWDQHGHQIIGTPIEDAHHHHCQQTPFTCAVVSQQMILASFGIEVSEAQLVYDATVRGLLTEKGTSPHDVAQLLELYGVPCHGNYNADTESLVAEIAQGHKVIVAVDSGELWGQNWPFEDWLFGQHADHALVVTGLDMSDSSHPKVYVNDPGDPQGAGKAYPLEDFLNAWQDSGRMYVATDIAPLGLPSHPTFGPNFDPTSGMYLNLDFWLKWLPLAGVGLCSTVFREKLSASTAPATPAATRSTPQEESAKGMRDRLDAESRDSILLSI